MTLLKLLPLLDMPHLTVVSDVIFPRPHFSFPAPLTLSPKTLDLSTPQLPFLYVLPSSPCSFLQVKYQS